MKFSEQWLREWVNPSLDTMGLAHRLTMVGHEVDAIESHGAGLEGVVVAEVLSVKKHPDADRLRVCQVSTGKGDSVEVVCGAPNVVKGMKSPFAPVGTTLPNGVKLRRSKIRGVVSNGMLCSAIEIGLGDESDGIIELHADAPVGQELVRYLNLPDVSFDLDLTPNRGDCFSVLGIAREVSAMTSSTMKSPEFESVKATIKDEYPVELVLPEGCPRFVARVIRHIDLSARSPVWLVERLRRSGLREIHPVVDVTNYVMLELGQPLHAYDHQMLRGPIRPRLAKKGEKLTLLDGKDVDLLPNTLVITDDSGPIGMAGIMGGLSTAVTTQTTDVFLEAAYWPPEYMAGRARQYGMHTDASLRFERGVDPGLQANAVERATELLITISGGNAGPLVDHCVTKHLPKNVPVTLRKERLLRVLGVEIGGDRVTEILCNLGLKVRPNEYGWEVEIPSYRFDIDVEDALVEEIARIYGYDEIPEVTAIVETPLATATELKIDLELVANTLVARDFQEVITYSFIDEESNTRVTGEPSPLILSNPISSEMSVMRGSIWPGLIAAASANAARQQERIRLFEIGKTFHGSLRDPIETVRVAGLITGDVVEEQWGSKSQAVDFFDIKADVMAVLGMAGDAGEFEFVEAQHPVLQPGQTATILRSGVVLGVIGKLHPRVAKKMDLGKGAFLFELDAEKSFATRVPSAESISKYPFIRRDIAVVVSNEVTVANLVKTVESAAPGLVTSVRVFDIYRGQGIEAGLKSVALGLILQETSRTLTDDDADSAIAAVVRKLKQDFAAVLRDKN
ncbi:MAG: phenylalanine--tRNA ligase subunit beta [Proteobacteria bacterium]|nr:phenylalanine--tRNA ligase subunit beta [Pseudomonadota bacterium]MDA0994230.1 phenylalanine--tRNA ligase subunit beta [Pseudomonadota bacterium]